jgi:hypothetical protein
VKNKLTTRGVAHFGAVQELPFTRGLHQGEQGRRPAVQDRAAVQDRTERGGCGGEGRAGRRLAAQAGRRPGDCVDWGFGVFSGLASGGSVIVTLVGQGQVTSPFACFWKPSKNQSSNLVVHCP